MMPAALPCFARDGADALERRRGSAGRRSARERRAPARGRSGRRRAGRPTSRRRSRRRAFSAPGGLDLDDDGGRVVGLEHPVVERDACRSGSRARRARPRLPTGAYLTLSTARADGGRAVGAREERPGRAGVEGPPGIGGGLAVRARGRSRGCRAPSAARTMRSTDSGLKKPCSVSRTSEVEAGEREQLRAAPSVGQVRNAAEQRLAREDPRGVADSERLRVPTAPRSLRPWFFRTRLNFSISV